LFAVSKVSPNLGDRMSLWARSWPYLGYLLFVTAYSLLYLADGFNGTDEGYLQSLAMRILGGELPYTDFYFLRPPLSLYMQAGLIRVFGDQYTILAARWFWTGEMALLVIMLSSVYRRHVTSIELFIMLVASWIVSTLLIAFPWYSYDAVFFAVVALVMIHRHWFVAAGLAIMLAGMCKQNYLMTLPALIFVSVLIRWWKKPCAMTMRQTGAVVIGFVVAAVGYLWYCHALGSGVYAFFLNVFALPRLTSEIGTTFAIFQDNPTGLLISLPTIAMVVLLVFFGGRHRNVGYAALLCGLVAVGLSFWDHRWFIYQLVFLNYTLLFAMIVRCLIGSRTADQPLTHRLMPVAVMALLIQYLAGFNYSGLVFSYMGAAPGLMIGYLMIRETCRSEHRRMMCTALLLVMIGIGVFHKYDFVARDAGRSQLDTEFATPKLAGVYSTERNVNQVDGLVAAVEKYTEPGDDILVFPDFPLLYYLTGRKNPTRVGWYALREFNLEMLDESIAALQSHPPKLIMLQEYPEGDHRRVGRPIDYVAINRFRPFVLWLFANYKKLETVGDVAIFVPVSPGADQEGD